MVPEMPSFPTLPNGNEVRVAGQLSLSLSSLSLSLSDTHRCAVWNPLLLLHTYSTSFPSG